MKWKYQSDGWRPDPSTLGKVIDIGGANSFAHGFLDAVVDIREPQASAKYKFVGNIDFQDLWDVILSHVSKRGKWDYAICTHTLEDINNPLLSCINMPLIAKSGLIIVPSKFREFSRFNPFRGFIHHRWIFDVIDGQFTGFPKINYIEDPVFDQINKQPFFEELVIEWEGAINLKYINDGMPYGTAELSGDDHIKQLYKKLI
jgi:hypothetical protein